MTDLREHGIGSVEFPLRGSEAVPLAVFPVYATLVGLSTPVDGCGPCYIALDQPELLP